MIVRLLSEVHSARPTKCEGSRGQGMDPKSTSDRSFGGDLKINAIMTPDVPGFRCSARNDQMIKLHKITNEARTSDKDV